MRKKIRPLIAIFLALGLGAQPIGSQDSQRAGNEKRTFTPPPSGHLTDGQVRMYIAVRRAATALHDDGRPSAPPAEVAEHIALASASELSATRRLGVNGEEYRWVRARIVEASAPAGRAGESALLATIEAQAKTGTARVQSATDAERNDVQSVDTAAIAWNREFLKKYRAELDRLAKRGR